MVEAQETLEEEVVPFSRISATTIPQPLWRRRATEGKEASLTTSVCRRRTDRPRTERNIRTMEASGGGRRPDARDGRSMAEGKLDGRTGKRER